jgi:methionyl-tRNA formyltransferase
MSKELRIIFLGTPEFAAESLKHLVLSGLNVVAVITAPDKPKGRGKKISTSVVKDYAVSANIPILQPPNLKSEEFLAELKSYQADLQIVVAFRMLPEVVWNMPRLGTFNLHASLLPDYRGAAPINWAIINGEKETGVTTFLLKHEIDTGEIIYQEKEPIYEDDTVGTLYARLMNKGADLVVKTAKAISDGNYPQTPQKSKEELKTAPKIFKEDCKINWDQESNKVRDFIRGLSPYPGAWTLLNEKVLKIFDTKISKEAIPGEIGHSDSDNKTFLRIKTQDGSLEILDLQLEGKKRMHVGDFLRGYQF